MASEAETMALCAIRYTIGRRSYIVGEGQRWAREWGAKSKHVRDVIARDLREAAERTGALGCVLVDEPGWLDVLRELEAHDGS